MNDNLNVVISAEVQPFVAGVEKATATIQTFEKSTKKIVQPTNQAGQALFNLGRVAQDAPFGFIAIQNNVEPLVQSLQSLKASSGGVGGALKSLGASLSGPTGILLGFSLVTSAITVAVQKYGSLGAAIDSIFEKNSALSEEIRNAAKSYEDFNKQVKSAEVIKREEASTTEGLIAKVQILSSIVTDNAKSYKNRNTALEQLKSISKDYFGNLDIEKLKVSDVTTAVEKYTQSIINVAMAKGFEDAISKTNVQLFEQKAILNKLNANLAQANSEYKIIGKAASRDVRDIISAQQAFDNQATVVSNLTSKLNGYRAEFDKIIKQQVNIKPAVDNATKTLTTSVNKAKPKVSIPAKIDIGEIGFNRLMDSPQIKNELAKYPGVDIPVKISSTFIKNATDSLKRLQEQANATFNIERFNEVAGALNNLISPAVNTVFQALENGQSIFQALGQSLKRLVVQLAATVAKAAILAAILSATGLGGLGTGGFGALFQTFLGAGGGRQSVGGGIGALFSSIGGVAAPSFNASGFAQGGINLSGQVVFVQRGPDLVGVLNNANSRIGRAG